MLLTVTQLLFFQDTSLASAIPMQGLCEEQEADLSPLLLLRAEEVVSLKDCVAVFDMAYTKVRPPVTRISFCNGAEQHNNTFRFVMPNGRHLLLRARDEHSINEWIHLLNYASTFRTTGLKMYSGPSSCHKATLHSIHPPDGQRLACISGLR